MSRLNKDLNIQILTDSRIRTLSASFYGNATPDKDSGPYHEIPHNSGNRQWNTISSAAFARYGGFDFQECQLKDAFPVKSTITQTANPTAIKNIWIPTRGRILFYIKETLADNTYLNYQISEVNSGVASMAELRGIKNTLLLCPRDEGIGNNEPMTVTIWRTRNDAKGEIETGERLTLYCHTYAEPEIKITNPRNLKPHGAAPGVDYSPNYPIFATDVINKLEGDDIDDVVFVCPVLSLMVTQDGLDDSGIPSFTRVSIKEFPGYDLDPNTGKATEETDKFTGYFDYPSNESILSGTANSTCIWTGVFRDSDGSVISLSGMTDQRLMWSPKNMDVNTLSKYADHTLENAADIRVCFRAGYKYLITVRRFHGYAAGYANINSGGYPQYGYRYTGSDYPPYYKAYQDTLGQVADVNDRGEQITGFSYAGPPLDYDADENNRFTKLSTDSSLQHDRWVGPYAGDTQDPDDVLYPGFSKSDYIILDCVRNQTSTKNLITVRPGSQEISADHWITFGYRHLDRAPNGFDEKLIRPKAAVRDEVNEDLGEVTRDASGNIQYINRLGMLRNNNDSDPYTETIHISELGKDHSAKDCPDGEYYFNHNWEGTDTTARRVGKMYTALVSIAIEKVRASGGVLDKFIDEVIKESRCPGDVDEETGEKSYVAAESNNSVKPNITIELVHPTTSDPIYKKFYYQENYSKEQRFNPIYTYDFLGWYSHFNAPEGCKPPVENYESGIQNGSGEVIYDTFKSDPVWGNEYEWVPIINPQNGTTRLPVAKTCDNLNIDDYKDMPTNPKLMYDPNRLVDSFEEDDAFQGYYIEEGSPQMGGCSYDKFMKLDHNHTMKDVDGYVANYSHDSSGATQPSMPTFIHESNVKTSTDEKSTQAERARAQSNRHFSTTSGHELTGYGGRQFFTYDKEVASQLKPGRLYLRVPTKQDCENGTSIQWNPRLVANRFDFATPTVRTVHYEFYKTHIAGELRITLSYNYKKMIHIYDDEGDSYKHEIETVTDEKGVTYPKTYLAESVYTMTDIGLNTGRTISNIEKATSFDDVTGRPQGTANTVGTYNNALTVFGEDNNGLGRCLTAGDFTSIGFYWGGTKPGGHDIAFNYINEFEKAIGGNGGGIEMPIRVRYTPIAQPEINTYVYPQGLTGRTTKNTNVISVSTCYTQCCPISSRKTTIKEFKSQSIEDNLRYKESFSVDISYGLYNDKCRGFYKTSQNMDFYQKQYRLLTGKVGDPLPNTDFYPAVGICNAFLVVLFPNGAVNSSGETCDYSNQESNWWSKRSNYETVYSVNNVAKPVIVAELAATDIYKTFPALDPNEEGNENLSNMQINNYLSTTFRCVFNYSDLIIGNKVITNSTNTSFATRNADNKLEENTWYDLVVVPIFTDDPTFKASGDYDMDFKYIDGAGSINNQPYGGGAASATVAPNYTYFYGSNPLVVKKFLNIAKIANYNGLIKDNGDSTSCGSCGGGGGGGSSTVIEPPFSTEGCILYPNVNHFKFNPVNGRIKECPGFWLNNTFRVIIRAPHFRKKSTIQSDSRYRGKTYFEQSLESASNNQISNPEEFEFSDVMIHVGKYTDYVRVRDESTGTWEYETSTSTSEKLRFNSAEFQSLINQNALNKQWLNDRGIYTIRNNPEAWSKRVPEVYDNAEYSRDTIKAGSVDSSGSHYKDRMVVFNPNMVGAYTYYPEGFYLQVRFLNAMYATTSQQGTWSAWSGGILDDTASSDLSQEAASTSSATWRKDESLEYYVPVRSFTDILTSKRNYIKESTPGSNLTTANSSVGVTTQRNQVFKDKQVKGSGGTSPNHEMTEKFNVLSEKTNFVDQAEYIKHSSMLSDDDYVVPEDRDITTTQEGHSGKYSPWEPDNDYTDHMGYMKDPDHQLDDYKAEQEVYKRHLPYHEMMYLDYVITNMAKLYYSDWSEQCHSQIEMTPVDFGWSLAKEVLNNYTRWSTYVSDAGSNERKLKVKSDRLVTDKFFRQPIKVEDFDRLLRTLQKLVNFSRDERWSGTHTIKTDTTDSQGVHTGETVLPVDGSRLSLDKKLDNNVLHSSGMVIGADISRPTESNHEVARENDWNYEWKKVEHNYIDELWNLLKTLVIQDSDPTKAY